TYHGFKPQEIDSLMRNGDPTMAKMAQNASESIMNDRINALVSGKTLTPDQIKADYAGHDLKLSGTQIVEGADTQNQHVVTGAQNKAGDNPNQGVGNPIGGDVNSVLATAGTAATPTIPSSNYFGQNSNTDWDGKPMQQTPIIDTLAAPGQIQQQGDNLRDKIQDKIENTSLPIAAGENALSSVAPTATSHLMNEGMTKVGSWMDDKNPGQRSGDFFQKDADSFKGSDLAALGETVLWGVTTFGAGFGGGKVAESIAEKGAEKLATKATESAAAKITTEEGLTTVTQEASDAGQNLVAKQADAKTAEAKYIATDKMRFGPDDTVMQYQLRQDKLAMDKANTDVEAATARNETAQDALTTSQSVADKAAKIASDDTSAETAARRNVPKAETLGHVVGAGIIGRVGKDVNDDAFSGTPGKSNLGSVLGGGQAYMPQDKNADQGAGQSTKNGDMPLLRS
ncbi:MAG: hypothetical protein ACYCSS_14405, partial [Sulfuriferula sp.]